MKEEIKQKEAGKIIEEMKTTPCVWPSCNEVSGMMVSLQALKPENNQLVPMKDVAIPMKFCRYHQLIAMSGLCGAVQHPEDPTKWNLYAPVEIVKITETVIASMMLSGQWDELAKTKKKAEEMLKTKQNKEVQPDEDKRKDEQSKASKPKDTNRNK